MTRKKAAVLAIVLAGLYGGSDEIHQHFTQGRESQLRDVGFDTLGAILAMLFTVKVLPKLPKEIVDVGRRLELI